MAIFVLMFLLPSPACHALWPIKSNLETCLQHIIKSKYMCNVHVSCTLYSLLFVCDQKQGEDLKEKQRNSSYKVCSQ